MDQNTFFQGKYLRGGACIALIAAILLTLLLPGMKLTEAQPESPLTGDSVRDITVLHLGESTQQSDASPVPGGGRRETPEQDQDNSETQPQPDTMQPDPSTEDGSDGQEDDNQGADGGELSPDELSMVLSWYPDGANARSVSCAPDKTQQLSVNSYELTDGLFRFSVNLTGTLARDGEITEGHCVAESDQTERELRWPNGTLLLSPAAGRDEETYNLSFTVRTGERNVYFRYRIVYRVLPDVQLTFAWLEGRVQHELQPCKPEGNVSAKIKNNQLSGGSLPYELKLTGRDAANARIWSVSYTSAASGGGSLTAPKGSLPMETPPGETSNTYTIAVGVIANSQSYHYEVVLHFGNDVTLQMRYTLSDGGQRTVFCENKRAKTADTVYDDQLVNGLLDYELSIIGEDADSVTITSVKCRQSGDGNRTRTIAESGQIALLLDGGKTGQNEFTVEAEDSSGNGYTFSINIPYKHKGTGTVEIVVDPDETHELINDTKNNLTVTAWSDYTGQREYIRATGTDTILRVVLDGAEITYTSTSGSSSEYDLYPANPETGDVNTHTLYIYAEDAYGNYGEKTLVYTGRRRESGQKIGEADIYVDMTVLGAGVVGPVHYDVLADEPVSYVIAKAIMGMDTGDPYGAAADTLGWPGYNAGTLDTGFYLQRLDTDRSADALEGGSWPGSTEEEVLAAIDARFGKGTGLASLWRCLYRNGLNKSTGSGSSFGEFDYTSGSGWMYALNGAYYPGQSMSAVHLKDGDVLTLRYTLAYGWDVGGGSDNYGNIVGYCAKAVNGYIEVSHQMETVEDPDGSIHYVCHCCGLVEDCTHEHTTYKDLEDGTHILFCEDCKTAIGDPQSHNWTYAAENTEDNHVCTECGAVENHFWREVDGSNTATCTEPGVKKVVCSVCGMEREEEAPAKGHTLDNRWNYTAMDHYQRCSTCGEEVSRGSHEYEADFGDYACRICNAIHEEECGGEPVLREATCQRKVYHCDSCGYDLTEYGVFEEYHDYVEGFCRYCGAQDPDYVPHTHEYRETGRVEPTCTENGYIDYACDCGDTYQETLPATGHTWGEWTPTEDGRQVRYCQVCGAEEWAEIQMSFLSRLFRWKF